MTRSKASRRTRLNPTSTEATRPGYCPCGEPHSTSVWSKTLKAMMCRRCHDKVPVPKPPEETP